MNTLIQKDTDKLVAWANSSTTAWGPAFNDALSVAQGIRDAINMAKKQIARPEVAKIIKKLDAELNR